MRILVRNEQKQIVRLKVALCMFACFNIIPCTKRTEINRKVGIALATFLCRLIVRFEIPIWIFVRNAREANREVGKGSAGRAILPWTVATHVSLLSPHCPCHLHRNLGRCGRSSYGPPPFTFATIAVTPPVLAVVVFYARTRSPTTLGSSNRGPRWKK